MKLPLVLPWLLCWVLLTHLDAGAADGTSWVGKSAILKRPGIHFFSYDQQKKPIDLGELTSRTQSVLEETETYVKIRQQDKTGWIPKTEVVLVQDAVAFFSERIRANPKDSDAYYRRAAAWDDQHATDNVVKDIDEAIRLDPKNADYRAARSIACVDQGQLDRAIAEFTEAIRLNPKEAGT